MYIVKRIGVLRRFYGGNIMKLLKCPKCGELFADSYKECPFCQEDEAYLSTDKKAKGPGRRVEKAKSPSILGPALIIVVVLLAGFLVYTFLGDRIANLFAGADKPPIEEPIDGPDEPTELTLNKTEMKLTVGDNATLVASAKDGCQWNSSSPEVATVDENGKITAVAAGETTITAMTDNASVACTVTVEDKAEPDPEPEPEPKPEKKDDLAIETIFGGLNKNSSGNWEFTESVGQSFDMLVSGTDSEVDWSSSNKKVATVSADGTFKAVGSGKATITATVDGQTLKCDVIIN